MYLLVVAISDSSMYVTAMLLVVEIDYLHLLVGSDRVLHDRTVCGLYIPV